ncbi:hypothetical protein [Mycolicibacterium arseniciresistens]|uniref:Uncharacterized protein n=1 Tax=Mycolicibacterium arseniciresistens TaxID=3062257 RepID=A0ABT8UDY7_9MYCO|nr:hypothetical protein [Mycolicibacterium arseniciresistens]MDO3636007.1 hypothetical protein [Mycolicibacterium arseniciresistens]
MTEPEPGTDTAADDAEQDAAAAPSATVRVPVRGGSGPFDAVEYADVAPAAAAHWDARAWHAEPPR